MHSYWKPFLLMIGVTLVFVYHLIRYRNPYKLYMVIGKKGAGKSTLMTKLALRYSKKKRFKKPRPVYCNTHVPGTFYFDTEDIGFHHFPENAVIMIDEVGMIWDNRGFKGFKPEVRDYFKLQRHYKHTVYLFSQSFDVDKKLRDLTDHMYLISNFMNFMTVARRITRTITITEAGQDMQGESRLVDQLKFDSIFLIFFGSVQFTYIPKYVKYFNSYDAPPLPHKEYSYTPRREVLPLRKRLLVGITSYCKERSEYLKQMRKTKTSYSLPSIDQEEGKE